MTLRCQLYIGTREEKVPCEHTNFSKVRKFLCRIFSSSSCPPIFSDQPSVINHSYSGEIPLFYGPSATSPSPTQCHLNLRLTSKQVHPLFKRNLSVEEAPTSSGPTVTAEFVAGIFNGKLVVIRELLPPVDLP